MFYNVFVCFYTIFVCLSVPGRPGRPPGRPRGSRRPSRRSWGAQMGPPGSAPGALLTALGGSWRHRGRSRGASGGLLALVWSPGTSSSSLFFFPEALCFRVLCHRSRNRHRLLVFSFGNFRSTWALALVSRAWACALESWALARGSWALAWGHGL